MTIPENNDDSSVQNRRIEERTKSLVHRTVRANLELETGSSEMIHLYVRDISANGLRVNLDRSIEPETSLKLSIPMPSLGYGLCGELNSDCRVVWTKPLTGGTCILGLEFLEPSQEHQDTIAQLLEHWQRKANLDLKQLKTTVDAKVRNESGLPWSPMARVRSLSQAGFCFHFRQPFDIDQEIEVRLLLEPGTIESRAKIRWCEVMPTGVNDVGCEFLEPTKSLMEYITLHLRRSEHRPI